MKGQSLLELIIAIGIFAVLVFSLATFLFDSFISERLAQEFLIANLLAEEGMEAVRSIRDNDWQSLTVGNHGLAIFDGHFVFQGESEDVSDQLRGGIRQIQIEDIDSHRKKVISKVSWQFSEGRLEEVKLSTYLTNWRVLSSIEIRKPTSHTDFTGRTTNPQNAYDYPDGSTFASTFYSVSADPSITFHSFETSTKTYTSLVLKFRYHAQEGVNDRYAVAYSITGYQGTFIDLISPTSAAAPDTTLTVNLPFDLDLSQLCLKIYTQRVGGADNRYFYTRDIWVEGIYLE